LKYILLLLLFIVFCSYIIYRKTKLSKDKLNEKSEE